MPESRACETCSKPFKVGEVLAGWLPCRCGGHSYLSCRDDRGGCGQYTYQPQVLEPDCLPVPFGFSP